MSTRKVEPLYLACSPVQALMTWLGIGLNGALILLCLSWLGTHVHHVEIAWPWFIVVFFVGLFVADFVSGLVHWGTDTWFDEAMFERVVSIAREHHLYPQHIVGYGVRDYVGYSSWPTVVLLAPIVLPITFSGATSNLLFLAIFLCAQVALCMCFGTYAHRLGHMRTQSRVIRALQRLGFLITPAYHGVHHSGRHDIRYCVINGWANPLCDRLRVWRALERLVTAVTGAVPRRNDREWFARFALNPSFVRQPLPSLLALRGGAAEKSIERPGAVS